MIAGLVLALAMTAQPAPAQRTLDMVCGRADCVTLAQYDVTRRGYTGTGDQFGRGWERDRRGAIRGTGRNFGGGFDVDKRGKRFTGTGERFGGGYESSSRGRRIVGTGNNFGKGWELSRNGREWIGTGGNFGKSCPARPGSSFVPCM